jgi:hypothetical protein
MWSVSKNENLDKIKFYLNVVFYLFFVFLKFVFYIFVLAEIKKFIDSDIDLWNRQEIYILIDFTLWIMWLQKN